jgi:hypothetical protein
MKPTATAAPMSLVDLRMTIVSSVQSSGAPGGLRDGAPQLVTRFDFFTRFPDRQRIARLEPRVQ